MKKKIWIPIVIVLIAVLFIPIPSGVCQDGGTREYLCRGRNTAAVQRSPCYDNS